MLSQVDQFMILTGSRVYAALGSDHGIFRALATMSPTRRSAPWSLLAQGSVSVVLVLLVGTSQGRATISASARALGLTEPAWQGHGGFDSLMRCTAPIFWFFFLLTGVALFILRFKDPERERPFTVPLYPLLPLIFCSYAGFMLIKSLAYAGPLAWVGLAFLAAGFPLYLASAGRSPRRGLSQPKGVET